MRHSSISEISPLDQNLGDDPISRHVPNLIHFQPQPPKIWKYLCSTQIDLWADVHEAPCSIFE